MDPDNSEWSSTRRGERIFLQELVQACTVENLPLMVRGILTSSGAHKKKISLDTMIDDHSYLTL
jgi:hypothetical protein